MQSWRQEAACRDTDPKLFFPSNNATRQTNAAKAICRGCVCRVQCLEYAIATDSVGIWGGTTDDERTIISGIFSSSSVLQGSTSPELEPQTRKESCTYSPKPVESPAASIRPLVLSLPKLRESHIPGFLEIEVAQVAVGFSAPALTLRFS